MLLAPGRRRARCSEWRLLMEARRSGGLVADAGTRVADELGAHGIHRLCGKQVQGVPTVPGIGRQSVGTWRGQCMLLARRLANRSMFRVDSAGDLGPGDNQVERALLTDELAALGSITGGVDPERGLRVVLLVDEVLIGLRPWAAIAGDPVPGR